MHGQRKKNWALLGWIVCFWLVWPGHRTPAPVGPETGITSAQTIYLVRHAWHAGLVLRTAALDSFPVLPDFPEAEFLEIGWGDADYYRDPDPGAWTTFKAAILPTQSTLHVVGFSGSVATTFPGTDIIRLHIGTSQDFQSLVHYIRRAFALDKQGQPIRLGPGLYGHSYFYRGREHYYAFRNCNTWTARALHQAGFPLLPVNNLTVGRLIGHMKQYREVVEAGND